MRHDCEMPVKKGQRKYSHALKLVLANNLDSEHKQANSDLACN